MITNPDDDEFVIECHVPGKDTPAYGVITCTFTLADEYHPFDTHVLPR